MGVDQGLVRYIMDALKKGYDISSVRNYLWRSGYDIQRIDEAIREVRSYYNYSGTSHVHHTIHLSKSVILGILLVLALAITGVLLFALPHTKTPSKLLDLEITASKTVFDAGENIDFEINLLSMGSDPRNDIKVRYEIADKYGDIVQYKEEEIALQTRISKKSMIQIPEDADPGMYELRAMSFYGGKKASSKLSFRVSSDSGPSCNDGIKNQNEEGIDCGGICPACSSCTDGLMNGDEEGVDCGGSCRTSCEQKCDPECNDKNLCTEDLCVNGKCVYTPIVPCCGNFVCESSESYETCPADCNKPVESKSPHDIVKTAVSLAKKNPELAGKKCHEISEPEIMDQCFDDIAEESNMSIFCDYILVDEKRDGCYISFAMAGDYSVCDKIRSEYLKMSCEMLKDADKAKAGS